jgi:ankyrin repeat protein
MDEIVARLSPRDFEYFHSTLRVANVNIRDLSVIIVHMKRIRVEEVDEPMARADALPDEMLLRIFQELDVASLCKARLVQASWEKLSRDGTIWKTYFERDFGKADVEPARWEALYSTSHRILKEKTSAFEKSIWAIRKGYFHLLQRLVEGGVDLGAISSFDEFPVHIAATRGDPAMVELLLSKGGCEPNLAHPNISTPLYVAAQEGHADVCEVLIKYGANIEATFNSEFTPLHIAARRGHTTCVKYLLGAGAQMDATCSSGSTPLYIAAQEGRAEVIKILAEAGANIEPSFQGGYTPLYVASRNGHIDAVTYLLSVGASMAAGTDESTPIYVAR